MDGAPTGDAATLLAAALRAGGESLGALMIRHGARDGGALLSALGCAGNGAAHWEELTYDVARHLLPQDRVAALIEAWLPGPTALCALGAAALAAGADPLAPTLTPEVKLRLIARLPRAAQVAFETYGLAREVATSVVAQLDSTRDRA